MLRDALLVVVLVGCVAIGFMLCLAAAKYGEALEVERKRVRPRARSRDGNPTEMVTEAQEAWVHSDSPIAPVAGSAVSMVDLLVNPDRLADYEKVHPWASSAAMADCFAGLRTGQAVGTPPGYGGGFIFGAVSATELGPVGAAGVGHVSGMAGARIGRSVGGLAGCGVGLALGLIQ